MKFNETNLVGVVVIETNVLNDARGFFHETYREKEFREAGIPDKFVQHNHSRSTKGTLRGLHYQLTQPQGKLVRVSHGEVFDVAVDVRKDSPSFGEWHGVILSGENLRMMYIPAGFAHGFVVLSEVADFLYMCTDYYHPQSEQGILWNDPEIGIEWPASNVTLSDKDKNNPTLAEQRTNKLPTY
tara:strand:- start:1591 stop:2142 length:552 start_codon:yes stop_codon:yes gene_type:complete